MEGHIESGESKLSPEHVFVLCRQWGLVSVEASLRSNPCNNKRTLSNFKRQKLSTRTRTKPLTELAYSQTMKAQSNRDEPVSRRRGPLGCMYLKQMMVSSASCREY